MPTSEATLETERPSRYLVQLCQHATKIGGGRGHRRMKHAQGAAIELDDVAVRAEWSETQGNMSFAPWGVCTLQVTPGALVLRIEATDETSVRRIQSVLSNDVARIGRRENLTLNWI